MKVSPLEIYFVRTCESYPEQYDGFVRGKPVGYVRLRGGWFYVACPNAFGKHVFEAYDLRLGGMFPSIEDRTTYLQAARDAIAEWINGGGECE